MSTEQRAHALGQLKPLGFLDRFGNWLSIRKLRARVGSPAGRSIGDFGSGYRAVVSRQLASEARSLTLVDLALAPELGDLSGVRIIEGRLPDSMAQLEDGSIEIALCISVLEHLDEDTRMLAELHRVLAPEGVLFVNVPNWRGKYFLELAAFRLGLAPRDEMDDHRRYYDPDDLWPLLVDAGFRPHAITCRRHKFTLNTYTLCRKEP